MGEICSIAQLPMCLVNLCNISHPCLKAVGIVRMNENHTIPIQIMAILDVVVRHNPSHRYIVGFIDHGSSVLTATQLRMRDVK